MAPVVVGLLFIAAAEYGHGATADIRKNSSIATLKSRLVAALANPLSLLGARSPGGRSGPQQLTKPAIQPHERVLSEEREHPIDSVAAAGSPAATDNAPVSAVPPGGSSNLPNQGGVSPTSFSPFNAPFGISSAFLSRSAGPGSTPGIPSPPNGLGGPPPDSPDTPPTDIDLPGTPPGDTSPPATGGGTPVIPVPEPASWGLVLFGCVAVTAMRRRRKLPA